MPSRYDETPMQFPERFIDGVISDEVLADIVGRELLIDHLGGWPTFHDYEVVSIILERAPWLTTATCDMRATFYVFDLDKRHEDPQRKQGLAELLFRGIDDLRLEGFNHQNPIMGLSIVRDPSGYSRRRFRVEWGGTCMPHEVSFSCSHISVLRVIDLNPFRKSIQVP